jgi:hypothetical protein
MQIERLYRFLEKNYVELKIARGAFQTGQPIPASGNICPYPPLERAGGGSFTKHRHATIIKLNTYLENNKTINQIIMLKKTKKGLLSPLITAAIAIMLIPAFTLHAQDYTFDSVTGELTIHTNAGTTGWRGNILNEDVLSLVIDNGVTHIGDHAFIFCENLAGTLTIPFGVNYIGSYAFHQCEKLTGTLIIPSTVVTISDNAFYETDITALDLSGASALQTIGSYAFFKCANLTGALNIPSGVTTIGEYAFYSTGITALDLSGASALQTIGNDAFSSCDKLTGALIIPSGATTIGEYAFSLTDITELDLTQATGLQTIGDRAFISCLNLEGTVTIPSGVTGIGNYAFYSVRKITTLDLTNAIGLQTIGENAFKNCTKLTGMLTVPDNITTIGDHAFEGTNITALDLTTASGLHTIGNSVFMNCTNLTGTLNVPSHITTIGEHAFEGTGITVLDLPATGSLTIGSYAFSGCTGLAGALTIPPGTTSIGDHAFDDTGLILFVFTGSAAPILSGNMLGNTGQPYPSLYYPAGWTSTDIAQFNPLQPAYPYTGTSPFLLSITTASPLPDGTVGTAYSETLAATGVAPEWSIDSGNLPDGLSLSTAGVLSGTTTARGMFTFTVKAENDLASDTKAFAIEIYDLPRITGPQALALTIGYAATSTGAYTITGYTTPAVSKSSGDPAITWNSGTGKFDIAAGLTTGNYPVVLTATNSVGTVTFTFTFTVNSIAPRITGPTSMTLTEDYAATSTGAFSISGSSPVTVVKTSGNARITWNGSTHRLDIAEGLAVGEYEIALRATNSGGSATFAFTLTVEEKAYYLEIPRSIPGGTVTTATGTGNPFLALKGRTVTLILTPDEGYELGAIDVYLYGTSTPVPLTGTGLARTFVMPAGHITVSVTFKLISTPIVETLRTTSPRGYVENGVLYISGLTIGNAWQVYNLTGTLIYQGNPTLTGFETLLGLKRGVYIVTDGKNVVKVNN